MLDLNSLHIFLAVDEYGSFSEAGRKLHLSQPAISQTIDGLEKRFGSRLFHRLGRTVRLTDAGRILKPLARETLSIANHLDETMISSTGDVIGEIHIGCSTNLGKYLLPGLIAGFRHSYPRVNFVVLAADPQTILKRLQAGDLALGVTSKRTSHHSLDFHPYFQDELILIVPKDHPWARSLQVVPEDLSSCPIIYYKDGDYPWDLIVPEFNMDQMNGSMIMEDAESVEIAVEEGLGIAFVPRLVARGGLASGRIAEVKVLRMEHMLPVYFVRNHLISATCAQTEFWSFLSKQVKVV